MLALLPSHPSSLVFVFLKMPTPSLEEARKFIAEVREDNGGITTEDRDFLVTHRPSALRALQKIRRQLADSIKRYSTFSCGEYS